MILYNYIKNKYPEIGASENAEKLILTLKGLSDKKDEQSQAQSEIVYKQLITELQKIEDNIKTKSPEYQKKIV